jgi:hypothetical protein
MIFFEKNVLKIERGLKHATTDSFGNAVVAGFSPRSPFKTAFTP